MRADSVGLFWEDLPPVRESGPRGPRQRGPIPPIPETGWEAPSEFPNLTAAKVIGFDTETWDPELKDSGPGWARGRGHLIGVSLSVQDGTSWYFPIRHGIENGKQILPEGEATKNMDPAKVLRFLDHTLSDNRPKVGANLIYDLGWLMQEGVRVGGWLYDVQFAEALLDSETPDVTLDSLGEKYLGVGKETSVLYDWLARWLGGRPNDRQRANLFLSPPSLAGPYAEADASMPIRILERQWPLLEQRGALEVFHMECGLIPLLVKMRFKGANVDLDYAERLYAELEQDLEEPRQIMKTLVGKEVNPNARESIIQAFKAVGLELPTKIDKKSGEEKITTEKSALEGIDHPLAKAILDYRAIEKVKNTFVKGYILDKNVDGKIYCSFHPLKGEGGGTRSGRLASSLPNLQNIPVRTEIGKKVRKAFIASKGGRWRKWDYSQIEYRMLAHYATGPGAEELRQIYRNDPNTDYHEVTIALVKRLTGIELERRPAKNINFGLIYGMSEAKLARDLGLTPQAGKELFTNYHAAAPFARETMKQAAAEVEQYGYVSTILGRRSDFPLWGKRGFGEDRSAYPFEVASRKWGRFNIERAFTHKALNRRLQGSAADMMKKAMLSAYQAGLFEEDACGMPSLTVHDELDFDDTTDPDNPAWVEFKRLMEKAIPQMKVPVIIDGSVGPNWGEAD